MNATEIETPFAYDDDRQSIVVEQRFSEAQALLRQGLASMIEAGGKFAEIRALLSHNRRGGFDGWLRAKQMEPRTVYRMIDLHNAFGALTNVARLDIATTAAYLLAAPSAPEAARAEAVARAGAGERITVAVAQEIVRSAGTPDPEALREIVMRWLAEQVAEGELADDRDGWRILLRQILNSRNGAGTAADAWRDLRAYAAWPPAATVEERVEAVRAALAHLGGAAEPSPSETIRRHSWDGIRPVTGVPSPSRAPLGRSGGGDPLGRVLVHINRFVRAAGALHAWALQHPQLAERDAQLAEALAQLEDARLRALDTG